MMGEAMNHVVCRFVLCVLAILIVAPVTRAHQNGGGGGGGGGGVGSMAEPIFRLKRERRADPSAAAQLRLEIRRAQDELNRAIADARRTFVESTEYVTAVDEQRRAAHDYAAAREAVLSGLRQSPGHVAARLEIERLQRHLDELRGLGAPAARVNAAATALLERRAALTLIESAALKSDDSFIDARYAWIDGSAKMAALWRDFAETLRADPACAATRQKIVDARQRLASLSG